MSIDHHTINSRLTVQSETIDLGLAITENFDAQSILSIKHLLSLHPNWFISNLEQHKDHFTADIKDYASEKRSKLSGQVLFNGDDGTIIRILLTGTVDISIQFSNINGSLFVQTHSPESIDPTDPALLWIRAILQYLRLYTKKTPVTFFFRLLMNRMILQMNPSQRKICMMLAKITFVEVLVIIFILIGYKIFVL